MIDGRANNRPKESRTQPSPEDKREPADKASPVPNTSPKYSSAPGKRRSALERLREKQEEVAARYGRKEAEQEKDDMERSRK